MLDTASKGQSKYLVGVGIMAFAIALTSMNTFVVEYVLNTVMQDMEDNFQRYESTVYGHSVLNEGTAYYTDDLEDINDDLEVVDSSLIRCRITDPDRHIAHGTNYQIKFYPPGSDIGPGGGGCSPPYRNNQYAYGYGGYGSYGLQTYALSSTPRLFFYSNEEQSVYKMSVFEVN